MANIGFVGLGNMGTPMVENLLKAKHHVMVYDLVATAADALAAKGAVCADSLAELAQQSEIIFTMLPTGQQVSEVCLAENGLFANAKPDTLFIDCSSIDVATSRLLHEEGRVLNLPVLDAPVSGGVAGAQEASLTFMVGGEAQALDCAKPVLQCLGKTIVHAGIAGNGQAAKICNNMILGVSMIAVSEAFCLAEKLGLPAEKLFEISANASGQCWAMTSYCPVPGLVKHSPANNDYRPGSSAKMLLKDLRLSQEAAQAVGATTPLGAQAAALYSLFVNQTHEEKDFSSIIRLFSS